MTLGIAICKNGNIVGHVPPIMHCKWCAATDKTGGWWSEGTASCFVVLGFVQLAHTWMHHLIELRTTDLGSKEWNRHNN